MDNLYHRALAGKVSHMRNGFVGRHRIWDSAIFDQVRKEAGFEKLRFVVIGCQGKSSPTQTVLDVLRAHFACPVVTSLYHPFLATFLTSSHPYDLQFFGERESGVNVHVGPGVVNIESKLRLIGGEAAVDSSQYRGLLLVRGPGISRISPDHSSDAWLAEEKSPEGEETSPWFMTGLETEILTNGTMRVLETVNL